jgi:5'-nucleotidase
MNRENWDSRKPVILVTNDDGIGSPGLVAAVEAVRNLGHVVVAAPTEQQTARGRSLVGDGADHFHPIDLPLVNDGSDGNGPIHAWHINASPALVVRHALAVFFDQRYPDLVVSGINYGENLGNNISISGTVGAAFQAAAQGIPALAVSRQTDIAHHFEYGDLDWTDATRVTRRWAQRLLELTFEHAYHHPNGRVPADGSTDHPAAKLPFDVLKLDIPDRCPPETEERLTRLSQRHYFMSLVENPDYTTPINAARTHVDIDRTGLRQDDDIHAVAVDNVISLTPLQLDSTAPLDPAGTVLFG